MIVLRIRKNQWISSNKYSFILSIIIKINRMMIIQQAWKKCDYDQRRQSNFDKSNVVNDNNSSNNRLRETSFELLQKVKSMINRFIIRENHEFMQWMLNLRTYELKIHYNITIENHIDWIENQILYKQMQFSMSNFRNTIHDLMKRT